MSCTIRVPGRRSRVVTLATTLLDPVRYPATEVADLYGPHWHVELDLRSLKPTLQMDVLRCQSPGLVRKELWARVLAYNLIRTVMARAAVSDGIEPRAISFQGAVPALEAFQTGIALACGPGRGPRRSLYEGLLDAVASHQVAD